MAAFTPAQRRIAGILLTEAGRLRAGPRATKALLEAGIVESSLRNLSYGDRDSVGVLQQRPSQGWRHAMDPAAAARDFLRQAISRNRGFHGSAGQLAQMVQRSGFPGRYDEHSAEASSLLGRGRLGAFPRAAPGAGPSAAGDAAGGQGAADLGSQSQSALGLLQALQEPQSRPAVSLPQRPAFSAGPVLPAGAQIPSGGGGPSPAPDIRGLLAAIQTPGGDVPGAQGAPGIPAGGSGPGGSQEASSGGGAPRVSSGRYPLGHRGKVIGTPFSGTHAKAFNQAGGSDNWQSENAVDISIPVGTPVYAVADGRLGNTGSLGQGGRFAGLRTNLISKGNAWYYAHLSKLAPGVRAGARVRKGQLLGYSGEANGVAHLHFAQEKGDPRRIAGR